MDNRALLDFLASRYARAQRELDELRQRGLELVIAACAADVTKRRSGAPAAEVPLDPSALSEADVTDTPDVGSAPLPDATVVIEPQAEPKFDPKRGDEMGADHDTAPPTDELSPPRPAPVVPQGPPRPAPPISPDPGVEDVRGAWGPPPGG